MWHSCLFEGLSADECLWIAEKLFALLIKEMEYLWNRGNSHLILFSLNHGYNNENAARSNKKSWADYSPRAVPSLGA